VADGSNLPTDEYDLGSKTLDEIFQLYSQKLQEMQLLEQGLATTERAKASVSQLLEMLGKSVANDNNPPPRITLLAIERELVARLASEPSELYRIQPRYFEELVCALLVDMGLDVHLTPATRDGGRDILAVSKSPFGNLLTIVECKRYAPHNKISVNELRSFLFTVRDQDRASCGLFATTSFFTRDAGKLAADYAYQLKLRDFGGLKEWLLNYGKWSETKRSGIWLPDPPVAPVSASFAGQP